MKNVYFLILFSTSLFFFSNNSQAQLQSYRLGTNNFRYADTLSGTHNILYFDIVLQHTNPDVSGPFVYGSAQYFLNFNPAIANGGTLSFKKIGSQLPPAYQPVNASIAGDVLRMAGNIPSPDGPVISTLYPGTLIARMRLVTTASSFAPVPLNLKWRTPDIPNPHVLIACMIGISVRDISSNGNFYVDSLNTKINVDLIHPAFNSSDNLSSINFVWNRVRSAEKYTLLISSDSAMNSIIVNDSLLTDTIKTITGFTLGKMYYWRLRVKDSTGNNYYTYLNKFYTKEILSSPPDNAINLSQTVSFVWRNINGDVSKYILETSGDSLMNSLIHSDTLFSDTSRSLNGFQYNSEYFWRLKIINSGGDSAVSEIRSFKTKNVSVALISPENNTVNNPVRVDFIWHRTLPDFPKYYLKISADSIQNDIYYYDSLSADTVRSVGGFDFNKKYYWTVSVKDSFNNFIKSPLWNFKTGLLTVDLYSPGNNSSGNSLTPLLIWRKPVINVSHYKLILSRDSLQADIIYRDSAIADTFKIISGLELETKYYWSITASDTLGHVKISAVWNFRTLQFLVSPENNSSDVSLNPVLIWRKPAINVSRYKLIFSRDSLQADIILADSSITDTFKNISGLEFDKKYFWSVTARDTSGNVRTSPVWTFNTTTFLFSPANNSVFYGWETSFLFRWYKIPTAVYYRLQVATDPSFENIIFADSLITDTNRYVTTMSLQYRYYWRISVKNYTEYFRFSEVWTFGREFFAPVELVSFVSDVSGNNVRLNWETGNEQNNSGFDIERRDARAEMRNDWKKIANIKGNGTSATGHSYLFTDKNLASGSYSYRLKQIDFNGNFEYFNLSNEVKVGIPTKFDLSQNYPNPFNPSTNLEFGISDLGFVTLKVYNASGKEVATLVNETKTAGYYTVNFNASNLSSGVYFYSLSVNNFTATKKMLLLK